MPRYRPCPDCGQRCTGLKCRSCYDNLRRPTGPRPTKRREPDARNSRAWTKLRDQVVREEPNCWLRLEVCTGASQTADHIIPVSERPDLALIRANLHGACHPCNMRRKAKPIQIQARPATWVM